MIKIIDDLLPLSYSNGIEQDSLNYIQYFWNEKTVENMEFDDPKIYDFGQLTCPFFHSDYPNFKFADYFLFLRPMSLIIQDKLPEIEIKKYLRVKFNMLHKVDTKYEKMYNTPHPDDSETDTSFSMVYYVNDSDGDTVLFNEFYDKNNVSQPLTICKRIQPKKNRLVIFDSKRYHASSNPILNKNRTVLNFVVNGVKR
jgi:hypothetical protein